MSFTGKLGGSSLGSFSLAGISEAPYFTPAYVSQVATEVAIVFDQPGIVSQFAVEVLAPLGGERFWVVIV